MPTTQRRRNQCQRDCDRTKLVSQYLAGFTLQDIANGLGISKSQACRDLKKSKLNWRADCIKQSSDEFVLASAKLKLKEPTTEEIFKNPKNLFRYTNETLRLYQEKEYIQIRSLEDNIAYLKRAGWQAFDTSPKQSIRAIEKLVNLGILPEEKFWDFFEAITGSQRFFRESLQKIFESK
ncbi:MAG: hypothetical protein PUP93_10480 [Rhizonema sp. NSF051]|nr:hypothetical protein [Rhizonema sp. NSF051]